VREGAGAAQAPGEAVDRRFACLPSSAMKRGTANAARMPRMVITTTSSIQGEAALNLDSHLPFLQLIHAARNRFVRPADLTQKPAVWPASRRSIGKTPVFLESPTFKG